MVDNVNPLVIIKIPRKAARELLAHLRTNPAPLEAELYIRDAVTSDFAGIKEAEQATSFLSDASLFMEMYRACKISGAWDQWAGPYDGNALREDLVKIMREHEKEKE